MFLYSTPKSLLIRKEVRTHLVGARTGSSAQPPCRRGGLGGGTFNKEKRHVTDSSSQGKVKPIETPGPHTLMYNTLPNNGEIVFKMLFIHKVKGRHKLQDMFLSMSVNKRCITLISILTSFRSVCLWLSEDTQYSSRLSHRGCALLAK